MFKIYRKAENQIDEGFSPFAKILIGSVSVLFGLMMIGIAPDTDKRIYFYIFGGFCLAISFACLFKGRARQFIGSCIGVCLVILSLWYLFSQVMGGGAIVSFRSEQSIFNALLFSIFFGLPGLSYACKAKFGFGRKEVMLKGK